MIVKVRYAIFALVITLFSTTAFSQVPAFPYPHHTTYSGGTIKPSHKTQTELDTAIASFYDQWKARYVINGCQPDHYYVYYNYEGNGTPGAITVSEAHGYGMIIAAVMAGYDANAKFIFDGMYRYFKGHPTSDSSYLMSWQQGAGCVNINGNDGATDGDLDIAYALLLADRQWGSNGGINYKHESINVITAIMQREMNQTYWAPLLGSWVSSGSYYNSTRSSDFITNHFRQFADVTHDSSWLNIVDSCYCYLETIQSTYSSTTGLLPDFIVNLSSGGEPAEPNFLEGDNDGYYSYNACRDPWRIATDYLLSGDTRAKRALDRINRWIRIKTSNIPSAIRAGYQLDGSNIAGEDYESQAFAAPFMVSAMINPDNQSWLNSLWDYCTISRLDDGGYYENTIKMLCLIVASGNWWGMQEVPGNSLALNVNRVWTDSMTSPALGDTVSITFAATGQASPLYYRYWKASGYQTPNYGNWQMLKDWSTASTLTWIPTTNDHYVIVAHVTSDPTSGSYHQAGLSIETSGNKPSPILIKDLTTTMSYPQTAGTVVNLNTIATGGSGQLYYKYWYCKGIGGTWNVIRDYSTSNSCTWIPMENGLYTLVVWVSDNTTVSEPPIAGMTCMIGE